MEMWASQERQGPERLQAAQGGLTPPDPAAAPTMPPPPSPSPLAILLPLVVAGVGACCTVLLDIAQRIVLTKALHSL